MHRMRAVALAAAALVLTATFPSGAARAGEPLAQADARRKREQVERQLDVARASDAQVEAELARLETDLANRRREATRVRAEAEAAMESVRVVRAQVEALRRQAAARQADFDRRIVDSYIHSGLSDTSASPLEALDAMDALRPAPSARRRPRDGERPWRRGPRGERRRCRSTRSGCRS
ncbi:MAG TPA: hypothetical protein VM618_07240, partial [Acidimicrobiia bacterium]|nr:hypothetical protein [Acidimicrobiia bacterium]